MTSKVQLDRDIIMGIFKHNLAKDWLALSDFKLSMVSKKCFLALKTACDEECKAAFVWGSLGRFLVKRDLGNYFENIVGMPEPVFWLLKEWSLCELQFGNNNNQRYLQLLRKIKGFDLKRIDFGWNIYLDYNLGEVSNRVFCDPDHRSEILRIISESSGTLKKLCNVPDIFLSHLPHTLKLEKLTAILNSIPMNSNINDCLQLSAKKVVIFANWKSENWGCYLPSHLLKNVNAQTLHVLTVGSWAEGIEESSVEIQANPSIQEIYIELHNSVIYNEINEIYNIKKIFLRAFKRIFLRAFKKLPRNFSSFQFFTKLFMKTEALLSELQDLPFSIKMKQIFEETSYKWNDCVKFISSLRKDEWKDFEEVQDDPRAETGKEYLSLKKSIQFGEGKSLEVTFFISPR